jgi:hypothetical protein
MKYEKPGPPKKHSKIHNRTRRHDVPRPTIEDTCAVDGCEDSTTLRWCHCEDDTIKFMDGGKGTGQKINDNLTALLCAKHDAEYSRKPSKNATRIEKDMHTLRWALAIIRSQLLRW